MLFLSAGQTLRCCTPMQATSADWLIGLAWFHCAWRIIHQSTGPRMQ